MEAELTELDVRALWSCSYGVYVVTTRHGETANGQIANTVFQVTAEPPRVAVAINKENFTHGLIEKSRMFAVSVLVESTPMPFIGRFGFRTGSEFDKLSGVEQIEGKIGCPCVTENAVSVFEAKVFAEVDAGTHTVFVADVVSGKVLSDEKPLTYAQYHAMKGRAPEKAPTFRKPETEEPVEKKPADSPQGRKGGAMQKYECNVCGYVYDPSEGDADGGIQPGVAFADLPDGWVCPVCGAGKDEFSPLD